MTTPVSIEEILAYWREAGPERWFAKDAAFDREIAKRFESTHREAARGMLKSWEETPEGVYALLLLLDQFPRNLFRNSPQAFATDEMARKIADKAMKRGFDRVFNNPERRFFYLPLMHSEDLADQERCIALCQAAQDEDGVKYAIVHRDIIRDFGRFPHRNKVLGRETTPAEQEFLDEGGFAG